MENLSVSLGSPNGTPRLDSVSPRSALPGGARGVMLIRHDPSVALVVFDGEAVVLVRQLRPGVEEPVLELPQETIEPGETPHEAAARGLEEECGLVAEE